MARDDAMTLTDEERAMVAANLGLVQWTLNRWFRHLKPHEVDDAWQDGVLGLCRAVQKFDPARARFATYAPHWIRQAVDRGRGDFEGLNYRSAKAHGRLDDYRLPLPLSTPAAGFGNRTNPITLVDVLADPAPPPEETAEWRDLLDRLAATCGDDVDRLILDAAQQHPDDNAFARDRIVAAQVGMAAETVRRRRQKMYARLVAVPA